MKEFLTPAAPIPGAIWGANFDLIFAVGGCGAGSTYEFGQGDSLVVDLIVEQELNGLVAAYENKSFYITTVYKHSKGPKQEPLPY